MLDINWKYSAHTLDMFSIAQPQSWRFVKVTGTPETLV